VDFSEVPLLFSDPKRLFIRYPGMTRRELRWQLVGSDGRGVLTVRFTLRNGALRIIGAGYWRRQKDLL
jgi:uncharacterized DUF497 family protein